jgi:hypothetical protein
MRICLSIDLHIPKTDIKIEIIEKIFPRLKFLGGNHAIPILGMGTIS